MRYKLCEIHLKGLNDATCISGFLLINVFFIAEEDALIIITKYDSNVSGCTSQMTELSTIVNGFVGIVCLSKALVF